MESIGTIGYFTPITQKLVGLRSCIKLLLKSEIKSLHDIQLCKKQRHLQVFFRKDNNNDEIDRRLDKVKI